MTRNHHRGSIYVAVLGAAVLVSLIGLTAMMAQRVHARAALGVNDFAEARLTAQAGLEMGMFWISAEPRWRTTRGNGVWATDVPLGRGTFSLSVADPVDGDVRVGDNDPVVLTSTGVTGASRYKLEVRLEVQQTLGGCLEVAMHAGRNLLFDAASITADQPITANTNAEGRNGAAIYADAEAVGLTTGGTYYRTTNPDMTARRMPDVATALDYYRNNGTWISYANLRLWGQVELLTNGMFATGIAPWRALGECDLWWSTAYARSGIYSLAVGDRETTDAAAGCDLDPATFLNGNTYYVKAPVLVQSNGNGQASVIVESTSGTQVFSTPLTAFTANTWKDLAGPITPTWSGQLIRATLTVTLDTTSDYYTDSVTLYDVTYPADHYVIDRKLLSPAVNPFGSQQTNPQGIYVIDCATKKITIANSRIVGTVVLVNPSASSIVRGSIQWEPAVPNYPALLADATVIISPSAAALSESTMNTNFNPAGSPYPYVGGSSNLTATDAYPSVIRGLIYSRYDFLFQGQPTIEGVVIAARDITATGAVMNVRYKSTWYNNPPPGFDADRGKTLQAVAGTWKRTVD